MTLNFSTSGCPLMVASKGTVSMATRPKDKRDPSIVSTRSGMDFSCRRIWRVQATFTSMSGHCGRIYWVCPGTPYSARTCRCGIANRELARIPVRTMVQTCGYTLSRHSPFLLAPFPQLIVHLDGEINKSIWVC